MMVTSHAMASDLPNLDHAAVKPVDPSALGVRADGHPPRILILYGSLRPESYSRKLALEAQRLLDTFGAQTRLFDSRDLPMVDSVPATHPKVQELRALSMWSQGQV